MARVIKVGDELEVTKDTQCAHMLHEVSNYPRKGVELFPIAKGTKLVFASKWTNFFGTYARGTIGDRQVDIPVQDLEQFLELPKR